MAKKKYNKSLKKIYILAITAYFVLLAISLLICYFVEAKGYVYGLTILGVSILFLLSFLLIFHDSLYKINKDDIEEIKFKNLKINKDEIINNLNISGDFISIKKDILYKTCQEGKKIFSRYLYLSSFENFDLSLEEFLQKLQNLKEVDKNNYFEAYIILFSNKTMDVTGELYKECRANDYIFTDSNIVIEDKLFKCLIYCSNENKIYYYKNNKYPLSLAAFDFIENELIGFLERGDVNKRGRSSVL